MNKDTGFGIISFEDGEEPIKKDVKFLYANQMDESPGYSFISDYDFNDENDIKKIKWHIVDRNRKYYDSKFQKLKEGKRASWNMSAFLFSYMWLFYRKMYWVGSAFIVLNLISTVIDKWYMWLLYTAASVFLGIFSNYLYLKKVDNVFENMLKMPKSLRSNVVVDQGLTSDASVWLSIAISILINCLLRYFLV